jgi:hypothetical protein
MLSRTRITFVRNAEMTTNHVNLLSLHRDQSLTSAADQTPALLYGDRPYVEAAVTVPPLSPCRSSGMYRDISVSLRFETPPARLDTFKEATRQLWSGNIHYCTIQHS